jgi:hypothetical protein
LSTKWSPLALHHICVKPCNLLPALTRLINAKKFVLRRMCFRIHINAMVQSGTDIIREGHRHSCKLSETHHSEDCWSYLKTNTHTISAKNINIYMARLKGLQPFAICYICLHLPSYRNTLAQNRPLSCLNFQAPDWSSK